MHPVLVRITLPWGGHFDLASYGAMMALGTLVAVLVTMRLAKRDGLSSETVVDLAFWAVISGVLGAKAWYIIQFWDLYEDKWDLLWTFRSGLVFYGGLSAAAVAVAVYVRYKKLSVLKVLDVMSPAGVLGLGFGRVGCFLNGCCFGVPSDAWCAVTFVEGSPAHAAHGTASLLPSQLFSSAASFAVFALLIVARRWRRFYGEQLALLFVLYPAARFTLELLRSDTGPVLLGMTSAQVFSVVSLPVAVTAFLYLRMAKPAALEVRKEDPKERRAQKGK